MAPILMTGASGYIGAAIAAELDRRELPYDVLNGRLEALAPASLRGYRHVIHAAGAQRYRGPAAMDGANRIGTQRLLAALDDHGTLLFLSTRLVYGHQPGRICLESDPALPSEFCGQAKLAAEQVIVASDIEHVILRLPSVIGLSPAGLGYSFFALATSRFMANEPVVRYTPDRQHDSLDLQALVQVCADWAGGAHRLPAGICNFPGHSRSMHETLAQFAEAARRRNRQPRIDDQVGPGMPWPFMSDARLRSEVGILEERSDAEIAQACCACFPA